MAKDRKIEGAVDSISNLPDEILRYILCYIPTKVAISTSILSRRWRHVWCDITSISLDVDTMTAASVNETLTRYTTPKTKSFHLTIKTITEDIPYIDRLIKLAMSHNVENLSLDFSCYDYVNYKLPDFFHNSSSFKQLNIKLIMSHTIVPPQCTVSWTSLQKLTLTSCTLSDESMAKILSGCPVLENLTLCDCYELKVLDLSKSIRLRTLEVICNLMVPVGPTLIVAPHIHYLRLYNTELSCSLVDVSSLTEANLEVSSPSLEPHFDTNISQVIVLQMLKALHNAEKLTLGSNFIKILSLGENGGVPFPMLKVKTLTLDTKISQYVPFIKILLQNSPDLETLTLRARSSNTKPVVFRDIYLKFEVFNLKECWITKYGISWNKHWMYVNSINVTSFVELMLKNNKLYKMVELLDELYLKYKVEEKQMTLEESQFHVSFSLFNLIKIVFFFSAFIFSLFVYCQLLRLFLFLLRI